MPLCSWFPATALAISLFCPSLALAIKPGEIAPDFRLPGVPSPVQLTQFRGQWVYLDFWATWCAPCRESLPWMAQLQKQYGPRGLRVVAVNVDTDTAIAERFLAGLPGGFTVAFDTQGLTPTRYDIVSMPSSMLIAPDGRVKLVHRGFRDSDRELLESQVAAALEQQPVNGVRSK